MNNLLRNKFSRARRVAAKPLTASPRCGSIFLEPRELPLPFFFERERERERENASTKEALERSRTSYKVKRYSLQHIIQSVKENETCNNQRKKTYKRATLFTTVFFSVVLRSTDTSGSTTRPYVVPFFTHTERSIFPPGVKEQSRASGRPISTKERIVTGPFSSLSRCFVPTTLRIFPRHDRTLCFSISPHLSATVSCAATGG